MQKITKVKLKELMDMRSVSFLGAIDNKVPEICRQLDEMVVYIETRKVEPLNFDRVAKFRSRDIEFIREDGKSYMSLEEVVVYEHNGFILMDTGEVVTVCKIKED